MQPVQNDKNLGLERLVFFSDAIIAIAITLLALDLKIEYAGPGFALSDLVNAWHKFAAFFLSFVMFWINHHRFFAYIKEIDYRTIAYNICWLLFIALIPVTSALIGDDFFNKPAMFVYSINVLLVTYFQNAIWDHSVRRNFTNDLLTKKLRLENQVMCKLAIGNAVFAITVAFLNPLIAFVVLLTRTLMLQLSAQRWVVNGLMRRELRKV